MITKRIAVPLVLSLTFLNCFSGCQNKQVGSLVAEQYADVMFVKGGTSFGQCRKDCIQEIQVTKSKSIYKLSSNDKKYRSGNQENEVAEQQWSTLLALIDFAEFWKLPDVVGCPDCSDGGAEWIEIGLADSTVKRVTYNFLSPPAQVEKLAKKLADERTSNVLRLKQQFPKEKFEDRAQSNEEYEKRKSY